MECDLHDLYGIDVWDEQLMAARPWPWLRVRILGLLSAETRVARVLLPRPAVPALP